VSLEKFLPRISTLKHVLSNAVAINFNKYLAFPLENRLTTLRISVIIPAYNEERYIGLTLENIFREVSKF